ncbi:MAG: hypothetical protein AAFV86_13720 [Pseudomonadota bacterium]
MPIKTRCTAGPAALTALALTAACAAPPPPPSDAVYRGGGSGAGNRLVEGTPLPPAPPRTAVSTASVEATATLALGGTLGSTSVSRGTADAATRALPATPRAAGTAAAPRRQVLPDPVLSADRARLEAAGNISPERLRTQRAVEAKAANTAAQLREGSNRAAARPGPRLVPTLSEQLAREPTNPFPRPERRNRVTRQSGVPTLGQ